MFHRYLSVAAVAAALGAGGSAPADEPQRLQGLFCNTEVQIDQVFDDIAAGLSPRRAADLANSDAVICTYVDRIEYLVARPVALGDGTLPLIKYRGALVGVLVGDVVRPITPEAELYFLTPRRIANAGIERRT